MHVPEGVARSFYTARMMGNSVAAVLRRAGDRIGKRTKWSLADCLPSPMTYNPPTSKLPSLATFSGRHIAANELWLRSLW